LPLDPYFSAAKLRWLLDNIHEAKSLRREGRLRFGTSDAFFLDRLAGVFATDVTTASRTSLMNLENLQWDPMLASCSACRSNVSRRSVRPRRFRRDRRRARRRQHGRQQAALFGHGCRKPGDAKITFGTGAFALAIAGEKPLKDPKTACCRPSPGGSATRRCTYAIDGGVYNAASAAELGEASSGCSGFRRDRRLRRQRDRARLVVRACVCPASGCPVLGSQRRGMWLGHGVGDDQARQGCRRCWRVWHFRAARR
jgi:glycerol kinase